MQPKEFKDFFQSPRPAIITTPRGAFFSLFLPYYYKMKRILSFLFLVSIFHLNAQTFTLTVNNGYGSGNFKAGDTIHIYSREEKITEVFDYWSGDTTQIADPEDWHTQFLMPSKNSTVTAHLQNLPPYANLQFEKIKTKFANKPVYYYFPPKGQKVKALVWLFHGSGGSVNSFIGQLEGQTIIKALIANDYAMAVSECDERTLNTDFNSDGNIRWDYTLRPDSTSRDMQNLTTMVDTFIQRGYMNASLPMMSIGFSAGGAFSLLNGFVLNFTRGIDFCSQGTFAAAENSTMPSQFFMSFDDNHPDVGKPGNDTAYQNYTKFLSRGVCARFNMWYKSPLYPQFFKRINGIDSTHSAKIFNDLKSMNALNTGNVPIFNPDKIKALFIANPSKYTGLATLDSIQAAELEDQLLVMLAFHHYHSHYNGKLIRFLNEACGSLSTPVSEIKTVNHFKIYPNPAQQTLTLKLPEERPQNYQLDAFDLAGRRSFSFSIKESSGSITLNLPAGLSSGIYFLLMHDEKNNQFSETLEVVR